MGRSASGSRGDSGRAAARVPSRRMGGVVRQRGFITLPIMGWAAIAAGVVIVALGIAVKVQTSRLDAVKAEYAQFKGGIEALGKAAELAAKAKEAADKENKEKADAQNAKTKADLAGVYAAYRSLRDQRARGSLLPEAAPGSASPDRITFDRAGFDSALSGFERALQDSLQKATVQ